MGRLGFLDGQSDSPLLRARISFYENGYEGVEAKLKKMTAIITRQTELITGLVLPLAPDWGGNPLSGLCGGRLHVLT